MSEEFDGESYQSQNKKISEKRHVWVHHKLEKAFPDCFVKYDGDTGHDHLIQLGEYKVYLETKTCEAIIKTGQHIMPKDRPFIFDVPRIGRFKFDRRRRSPYIVSQHDDLVAKNGWYVFVVGDSNRVWTGIKASELKLSDAPTVKRLAWGSVIVQCHPDWLQRLKHQVYGSVINTDNDISNLYG